MWQSVVIRFNRHGSYKISCYNKFINPSSAVFSWLHWEVENLFSGFISVSHDWFWMDTGQWIYSVSYILEKIAARCSCWHSWLWAQLPACVSHVSITPHLLQHKDIWAQFTLGVVAKIGNRAMILLPPLSCKSFRWDCIHAAATVKMNTPVALGRQYPHWTQPI